MPRPVNATRAPRANPVPADETKEQKSTRLAAARMTATMEKLDLIGNLSSAAYSLTPAQVDVMENSLLDAVNAAVAKLRQTAKTGFVFPVAAPVVVAGPGSAPEGEGEVSGEVAA